MPTAQLANVQKIGANALDGLDVSVRPAIGNSCAALVSRLMPVADKIWRVAFTAPAGSV
jgi:hypothetical protein